MSDVEAEIAEIEEAMSNDIDAYYKNEAMQARYGELISAQEYGTAPLVSDRNVERLREIEAEMAKPQNTSEYWHNPEMQAEYGRLLEGREAYSEMVGAAGDQPAETVNSTLEEALGVTAEDIEETTQRVANAFEGIDITDMNQAFDGLSDFAKFGFYRVLFDPSILSSKESVNAFVREIGADAFDEILAYEAGLAPEEHAALKRACFAD